LRIIPTTKTLSKYSLIYGVLTSGIATGPDSHWRLESLKRHKSSNSEEDEPSLSKRKYSLHETSIYVRIYLKSVESPHYPILDEPIFESLLETSIEIDGVSPSGILVKVVIL
jgi:hypothetical protein